MSKKDAVIHIVQHTLGGAGGQEIYVTFPFSVSGKMSDLRLFSERLVQFVEDMGSDFMGGSGFTTIMGDEHQQREWQEQQEKRREDYILNEASAIMRKREK